MSSTNDQPTGEKPYSYGAPTRTGKIPFTPPGTDLRCETAYWLWGDLSSSTTTPLIVLHGGPAAPGRDWQPITPLSTTHGIPVLLYDQIGCGASTHLPDKRGDTTFWTDGLFLAELDNLKTHLQIATFDLLGHSCGGMLGIMYALTQPRGLRKLILASAPAADRLRIAAQVKQRAALPQRTQDVIRVCEAERRLDAPEYIAARDEWGARHFCRLQPTPPEITDVIMLMEEDETVSNTLYGGLPLQPEGPRKHYDVVNRLHEVTEQTVPGGVLLTNGRFDMVDDEGMAPFFKYLRARVKWMRFAESSHFPHLEEAGEYLAAVGDFLTSE